MTHLAKRDPDLINAVGWLRDTENTFWIHVDETNGCWSQACLIGMLLTKTICRACTRCQFLLNRARAKRETLAAVWIVNSSCTERRDRSTHASERCCSSQNKQITPA